MLRRYLRAAWKRGIYSVLLEVLRALRDRDLVEMRIVDRILEDIHKKTVKAMETIGTNGYLKVVSSAEPNLYPLKEMLRQKAQDQAERLRGYRYLVKQFDNPHITIGRRGQDLIRELSMETLEEGFLNGNPSVFTEKKLAEKIVKKGTLYKDEKEAQQALSSLHHDVVRDIPLFHEDGNVKFLLHEKTRGTYQGRYRAWDVERYADLVAVTTAAEADTAANIEHAKELGTRLIKWNSTGKGVAFYESIGDTRCAAVDGKVASIVPEGVTINGTHYPYYKELLPGPYSTCHPYCRHRMTPLPEEAVGEHIPGERHHIVPNRDQVVIERLRQTNESPVASFNSLVDSTGVVKAANSNEARQIYRSLEIHPATEQQLLVLEDYKNKGYRLMNKYLREKNDSTPVDAKLDKDIHIMDEMIAANTLPRDIKVYRGIRVKKIRQEIETQIKSISTAKPYYLDNLGFVSSSLDESVAEKFVRGYNDSGIILEFVAPSGSKFVKGSSYEQEIILARGQQFIIHSAEIKNEFLYLKAIIAAKEST